AHSGVVVMRLKQIVILGVAVAVLAAGIGSVVTMLGQSNQPSDDKPGQTTKIRAPLDIFPDFQGVRYEEAFTAGHHAFRFKSMVDTTTRVGINWKNCKCAGVDICLAPPEWENLPEAEWAKKADDSSLKWTPLEKESKGFPIPAKAIGWIRVGWSDDKSTDTTFHAELWLYEPDSGIGFPLEIPVSFVEPVRVRAEDDQDRVDAYLGRLSAGDQKESKFLFWSSTREKFNLEADPSRVDPCITYGEPTPLKQEDLDKLSERHRRKALSGYRVVVTAHEHVGNSQLDIGPFRRQVRWNSNASKE